MSHSRRNALGRTDAFAAVTAGGLLLGLCVGSAGVHADQPDSKGSEAAEDTCTIRGVIGTRGRARGPVVVFVQGEGPAPSKGDAQGLVKDRAVVGQKNKAFQQDAVVVTPGAEVVFPNQDAVHHHLYSHSRQDPFEFPQHAPGARPQREFVEPGSVRVQCNIHENMETHVLVLPNAWAAETDKDGAYRIEGVTPGVRTVEAWSAWHRSETAEIDCVAGETHEFSSRLRMRVPGAGGPESDAVY